MARTATLRFATRWTYSLMATLWSVVLFPSAKADTTSATSVIVRKMASPDGTATGQTYKKVVKDGKVVEESGDKALAEKLLGSTLDGDALLAELLSDHPDFDRLRKLMQDSKAGGLGDKGAANGAQSSSSHASDSASSHSESHSSSSDRKSSGREPGRTPRASGNTTAPNSRRSGEPSRPSRPPMSPAAGRFAPRPAPGGAVRRN